MTTGDPWWDEDADGSGDGLRIQEFYLHIIEDENALDEDAAD